MTKTERVSELARLRAELAAAWSNISESDPWMDEWTDAWRWYEDVEQQIHALLAMADDDD